MSNPQLTNSPFTMTTPTDPTPQTPELPPEVFAELLAEASAAGHEFEPTSKAAQRLFFFTLARLAYAAGANAELEAVCYWLERGPFGFAIAANGLIDQLRTARRPKPPSLKQQALEAMGAPTRIGEARVIEHREHELIRRALESLPDPQ